MATTYICKCGRMVTKSTSADNTGNRDTAGCEGCPYLLPWGPYQWDDTRHAMVTDVKGYECRMSPTLDYATYYQGGGDDKCVLHIYSLDYDFLDRVTAWTAEQFPEKEIRCSFDRSRIRAAEFSGGLYSMSVYPMPNKKGIAAKAALLAEFFGPDKRRRDMTPEEEKAHILAAIEAGKARAQKKEDKALTYKDLATGWLYRVSPKPVNGEDVYGMEYLDPKNSTVWKPDVKWNTGAVYRDQGHLQEELEARARRDGWEPVEEKEWNKPKDAPSGAAAVTTDGSAAAKCGVPDAETRTTPADASGAQLPQPLAQSAPRQTEHATDTAPVAPSVPVFDYSGLDAQTVEVLHIAEHEILTARQTYICRVSAAVAAAHEELHSTGVRNSDSGKYESSEDTFISWCKSVGLSKTTAYQLLQVNALLTGATPEEQATLEAASPSLLYAAAKPSAPGELVQAVKDGDITTHKQYQEAMAQLKAEREAREKAEQKAALAYEREEKARAVAHQYHVQYEEVNGQRNRLLDERGVYISRITEAEERAKAAEVAAQDAARTIQRKQEAIEELDEIARDRLAQIEALEKGRTIEAQVSDPEEVRRQAEALARELAAAETEKLQSENRTLRSCAPAVRQAWGVVTASMNVILKEAEKAEAEDENGLNALEACQEQLLAWWSRVSDITNRLSYGEEYDHDEN